MGRITPYSPEARAEVTALLLDSDLPVESIAEKTGVHVITVRRWRREDGLRGPWLSPRKRRALRRLLATPGIDRRDLSELLGTRPEAAASLFRACGVDDVTDRPIPRPGAADSPTAAELDAILRLHVARQIAAFDLALRNDPPGLADSARVLRDLGGLRRLIDDAGDSRRNPRDGDADAEPALDLAALRADIARRYEIFAGERGAQRILGEPAA